MVLGNVSSGDSKGHIRNVKRYHSELEKDTFAKPIDIYQKINKLRMYERGLSLDSGKGSESDAYSSRLLRYFTGYQTAIHPTATTVRKMIKTSV